MDHAENKLTYFDDKSGKVQSNCTGSPANLDEPYRGFHKGQRPLLYGHHNMVKKDRLYCPSGGKECWPGTKFVLALLGVL